MNYSSRFSCHSPVIKHFNGSAPAIKTKTFKHGIQSPTQNGSLSPRPVPFLKEAISDLPTRSNLFTTMNE